MTEPTNLSSPLGMTPLPIDSAGRRIALHVAAAKSTMAAPPLLLIHSVNATASAIEMHAFFKRQARRRSVVALDLPGFGCSDRAPGPFTPAVMVRAVQDAMEWIWQHLHPTALDVMALSLGCEFATLAAVADPDAMRSLTLVSPTAMERRRIGETYDGRTRQNRALVAVLRTPGVGRSLYSALTSEWSMRWFLSRSWGSPDFDRSLLDHGRANAGVRDAHQAPLDFASGSLPAHRQRRTGAAAPNRRSSARGQAAGSAQKNPAWVARNEAGRHGARQMLHQGLGKRPDLVVRTAGRDGHHHMQALAAPGLQPQAKPWLVPKMKLIPMLSTA